MATADIHTDALVIKSLYAALRTSIPDDARLEVLRRACAELKFLIAVQPRVSGFGHRRRHSLRHPALSMAVQQFYYLQRMRRNVEESEQQQQQQHARDGAAGRTETQADQIGTWLQDHARQNGEAVGVGFGGSRKGSAASSIGQRDGSFVGRQADEWGAHTPRRYRSASASRLHRTGSAGPLRRPSEGPSESLAGVLQNAAPYVRLLEGSSPGGVGSMTALSAFSFGRAAAARTPAVLSDDDAADEDALLSRQQDEDQRWELVADCYDQLLHAASAPVKVAALAAAADGPLNDIIRRFWDRTTVAPAAAARYADGAMATAEAARRRAQTSLAASLTTPALADVDAAASGELGAAATTAATSKGRERRPKVSARGRAREAAVRATAPASSATATAAASAAADGTSTAPGSGPTVRPAGTALYMTPLQYAYLNLRIARVLLPADDDVEMEMLDATREDLVMDSTYREDDLQLELYFGRAPTLVAPPGVAPQSSPTPGARTGSSVTAALERGGLTRTKRIAGPRSGARQQPWREALSSGQDGAESVLRAPSLAGTIGTRAGANERNGAEAEDGTSGADLWDSSRLPSLTYPQFWVSMMELADNWTCSAMSATECAVFLFELYGDVFGHEWADDDDDARLAALKHKHAVSVAGAGAGGDGAGGRAQDSRDVLDSFHEMLEELDELSGSDSGQFMDRHFGHVAEVHGGPSPTRRRSTKRFSSASAPASDDDMDSLDRRSDSIGGAESDDPIDWTGRQKLHGWRYRRVLDLTSGRWQRSRRRTVRRKQMPKDGGGNSSNSDSSSGSSVGSGSGRSDGSYEVLEDDLDSDNEVIRRRRLHVRHGRGGGEREELVLSSSSISHSSLSKDDDGDEGDVGGGRRGHRGGRSRQYRRLDDGTRKAERRRSRRHRRSRDGVSSAESSWTSYDSGRGSAAGGSGPVDGWQPYRPLRTASERGQRRRGRVRRTGQRPRHGAGRSGGSGDNDSDFSSSPSSSSSVRRSTASQRRHHAPVADAALSAVEREHLASKKSWLQRVLAQRGVHISDRTFTDPEEEPLLYQLLLVAERLDAEAAEEGRTLEDDDDADISAFDTALLARLFAKPQLYTLDELQQTELMQRLLVLGDEGVDRVPLTAAQMNGVLAALLQGNRQLSAGGPTTASVRRRREQLLLEARRLQHALRAAERQRASASTAGESTAGAFALTEADTMHLSRDRPHSSRAASGGSRPSPAGARSAESTATSTGTGDGAGTVNVVRVPTPSPPPRLASAGAPTTATDEPPPPPPPLTREQRREQERLLREFEEYCAAQAGHGGRYKLSFTTYTPAQLDAFFQHLGLGPQQRALLRGRAPLAPSAPLTGGTLRGAPRADSRPGAFVLGGGPVGSAAGATAPAALAPAPVKLFTLTTASSLAGAVAESRRTYLEDRTYSAAANSRKHPPRPAAPQRVGDGALLRARPAAAAAAERSPQRQAALPPLARVVGGGARASASARATPPSQTRRGRAESDHAPSPSPSFAPAAAATAVETTDAVATPEVLLQRALDAIDAQTREVELTSADDAQLAQKMRKKKTTKAKSTSARENTATATATATATEAGSAAAPSLLLPVVAASPHGRSASASSASSRGLGSVDLGV